MSKLVVVTNVLGSFGTNCYSVTNQATRETLIIDPADRADFLTKMYGNQNMKPVAILLTHGHMDHIGAVSGLREAFPDIKVYAAKEEKDVLGNPRANLSEMFGSAFTLDADCYIEDGCVLRLLDTDIKCLNIPGHTKGGMAYYFEEEAMVFVGDTLFASSIGRSDFPTGDEHALIENIKDKLFTLPEEVTVYPGHNSRTSIKREKAANPYFG